MKKIKQHQIKILGAIAVVFLLFFTIKTLSAPEEQKEEVQVKNTEIIEKKADVFVFGGWKPQSTRSVLGTVETESDVEVVAEVSGTLDDVLVEVGALVKRGQILARFRKAGDATETNYQNAVNNLEVAQITTVNSLRSAELSVENAKRTLKQARRQQGQTRSQAFSSLKTTTQNIESTFSDTLNFLDFWMGASTNFRYQQVEGRSQVGAKNKVLKNDTKNKVRQLAFDFSLLPPLSDYTSEDAIIKYTKTRLDYGENLQRAMVQFDRLVRDTIVDAIFTEPERLALLAEQESKRSGLNTVLQSLESTLEAAKTTQQGAGTSILSAQNTLQSTEAQLEITKAQNQSQLISAQNQVQSALSGRIDLEVRAPFDGIVSDRVARAGMFVSPGKVLFNLLDPDATMKVVAYLTREEWAGVEAQSDVKIEIGDAEFVITKSNLSRQIDPKSQKILVEFELENSNVLSGSLAQISVDFQSQGLKNLVPFSAVSFEPDGAEIMFINEAGLSERKKIIVDKILGTSISIQGGIGLGESVIAFYKRVLPGQKIIINNL